MTQNMIFQYGNTRMTHWRTNNYLDQMDILTKIEIGQKKIESTQGLALRRLLTRRLKKGKTIETHFHLVEIALAISSAKNLFLIRQSAENGKKLGYHDENEEKTGADCKNK